jgi:uncharacterized membrane protein YeaQ/YmgE (transglycosylase-associated protein family)
MEGLLQALGVVGIAILVVIGLLAGLIASLIAGGDRGMYMIVGVVAALATPFVLALIGVGVLAATASPRSSSPPSSARRSCC